MTKLGTHTVRSTAWTTLVLVLACSGGSTGPSGPTTATGEACTAASQCYATLDAAALHGTVSCLTQLQNGYCTHTCASDADCCAVPGECTPGFKEVCAPLESTAQTYCFLSCDTAGISAAPDAGTTDPTTYCQRYASLTFTCRSTGGGANNKKFCGP